MVTVDGPEGSDPVKVEYSAGGDTPGVYTGSYHPKVSGNEQQILLGVVLEF